MIFSAVVGVAALASSAAQAGQSGKEIGAIDSATGAALQGNGAHARAIMLAISPEGLNTGDRRVRECVIERFAAGSEPSLAPGLNGTAGRVLTAFRLYWNEALKRPQAAVEAEANLLRTLQSLLDRPDASSLDALSGDLEARLKLEGWWSLQGRTGRLRELMLWRSQQAREYRVTLPEEDFVTEVMLLDDFASLGWGDYATCGKRGAGGWATTDRLFAVVPRYPSLDSEEFRVTFLGHETQHFADLRRWPGLASWNLEYRAKLVELVQTNRTRRRVLGKFMEDRKDDPGSPHSYANLRVVQDMTARLGLRSEAELLDVATRDLNVTAAELLRQDTHRVQSKEHPE